MAFPNRRAAVLLLLGGAAVAQKPAPAPKPDGSLKQVMRGVLLPNSDVILAIQDKPPKTDTDWRAVIHASVAIEEAARLITIPGRIESNGQRVPVEAAQYKKFAAALVPAGRDCLKAARKKSTDAVANCTDSLTQACDNCHKVYRDTTKK